MDGFLGTTHGARDDVDVVVVGILRLGVCIVLKKYFTEIDFHFATGAPRQVVVCAIMGGC